MGIFNNHLDFVYKEFNRIDKEAETVKLKSPERIPPVNEWNRQVFASGRRGIGIRMGWASDITSWTLAYPLCVGFVICLAQFHRAAYKHKK